MSRIGKSPILLPIGVNFRIDGNKISVFGPHGHLDRNIPSELLVKTQDNRVFVKILNDSKKARSLQGLFRTLINNMVLGVNKKFEVNLQLKGVGYRCQVGKNKITLSLGFSHPIELKIPDGVDVIVDANVDIKILGSDKENVGFFAAKIRSFRPPEPYNGKGVLYKEEIILRKAGKSRKK